MATYTICRKRVKYAANWGIVSTFSRVRFVNKGHLMALSIKPKEAAQLDLVSLGECMLRLSPQGHGRLEFANLLEVWVGGGEYNVAYALARLGLRTGWSSRMVDNPLGAIVLNHARAAGVDVSAVAL